MAGENIDIGSWHFKENPLLDYYSLYPHIVQILGNCTGNKNFHDIDQSQGFLEFNELYIFFSGMLTFMNQQ